MTAQPSYDEVLLFQQLADGSESAFTDIFHLYTPKLQPFVAKLTRNPEQARELIQETFLQLWMNREQLKEVQHPSAWIYRIASNLSLNWLRNETNRRRLLAGRVLAGGESEILPEIEARQLNNIIHQAVDALPEKRRQIYRLSREQGLSHQQIADQLGLSINTVKNQIGISLKFIQEYINKETGLSLITILLLFSL